MSASFKASAWADPPDPAKVEIEKVEIRKALPSALELAQLASSMAPASNTVNHRAMAEEALKLWQACDDELEIQARSLARLALQTREGERVESEILSRISFPAELDEVLRFFDAGRSEGDRLAKLRKFLRDSNDPDFVMGDLRKGVTQSTFVWLHREFKKWMAADRKRTNTERAKKAAKASVDRRQA